MQVSSATDDSAATMDYREVCEHEFGVAVHPHTVVVRTTRKWFRKCFRCGSRRCYSTMVRCIKCRILVHERCTNFATALKTVDMATNTEPTAVTVDMATNTEPTAAAVDMATNTEPTAAAVDMATNTEPSAVTVNMATNTEPTAAAVDMATNTEPSAATMNMATNTEPSAATVNMATNTEPSAVTVNMATYTDPTRMENDVATDDKASVVATDETVAADAVVLASPDRAEESVDCTDPSPVHCDHKPVQEKPAADARKSSVLPVKADRDGGHGAGDASGAEPLSERDPFARLVSSCNPSVRALKELDLETVNPEKDLCYSIDFLDQIADEEGLTLLYENISSNAGEFSYVQLSITPIDTSTIGSGDTVVEAQSQTAYNFLLYLKHSMK